MAIDSRRKRASIASLGLAFLGASIVPDGSLAVGDRQTVANSYYGIDSTVLGIDVGGGTAILEAYASSGAITLEIGAGGGTATLAAYSSSGTVTLEINLGGTSQLPAFSSSGGVTVGDVVAEETATGGWWYAYDHEYEARKRKKKELEELEAKAEEISDDIDRELAKELRKQDREAYRIEELRRLSKLAAEHREELQQTISHKAILAVENAIMKNTYSAMEQMEREIARSREEEEFLIQATSLILNS